MRSLNLFITIVFTAIMLGANAQQPSVKKETIHVSGNCGMCKSTIEKAAKSAGASFALWNEDSKVLTVKYASGKTDGKKIQQAVAKSGYDTPLFKASDEAYNKLHNCCKYDRAGATNANDSLTTKSQQ